ncbi:hypothetical protein ACFL3V_07355, partial [Nanoarchaeota archaeon]
QPDAEGMYWLTEEGANFLKDTINSITEQVGVDILKMRKTLPEHNSGYRVVINYGIRIDDSFRNEGMQLQHFHPGNYQQGGIPVADVTANLEELPKEERQDRLKSYLKEVVGRDIATAIIAGNMQGNIHLEQRLGGMPDIPKHPAFDDYFKKNGKWNTALTDIGEKVFGYRVEKLAEQAAEQLIKVPGIEHGRSDLAVTYQMSLTDVDNLSIGKPYFRPSSRYISAGLNVPDMGPELENIPEDKHKEFLHGYYKERMMHELVVPLMTKSIAGAITRQDANHIIDDLADSYSQRLADLIMQNGHARQGGYFRIGCNMTIVGMDDITVQHVADEKPRVTLQ